MRHIQCGLTTLRIRVRCYAGCNPIKEVNYENKEFVHR
jgi:hypothetical protein